MAPIGLVTSCHSATVNDSVGQCFQCEMDLDSEESNELCADCLREKIAGDIEAEKEQ